MSTTALLASSHSHTLHIHSKYTLCIEDIYRLALAGWTREEIARKYRVRKEFISLIIKFANISTDEEYSVLIRRKGRGKLSREEKEMIQKMLLEGHSNYYIAKKLGVSIFDVNKVMREVFPGMGRWY